MGPREELPFIRAEGGVLEMNRRFDRRGLLRSAALLALGTRIPAALAATPLSKFGPKSTAEEVTANIDLTGMTAVALRRRLVPSGLCALELAQRLKETKATSNCLTPGGVRTNILRNVATSAAAFPKSPAEGAATICYVATSPALAGVSGEFFADCNPAPQSAYQVDRAMAARLWAVSEQLTQRFG